MSENREELEARIAAYIDGQLSAAEAARLEVFLANTDPQLAEQIIGMLADRHHVRALPRPAAPADLAGRIMEQVERATLLNDVGHLEHLPRPWWQSRAAIAAGLILLIGGFSWLVAMAVISNSHDDQWNRTADARKQPATLGPLASAQKDVGKDAILDREAGEKGAVSAGRKDAADAGQMLAPNAGDPTAAGERAKRPGAGGGGVSALDSALAAAGPVAPPAAPVLDAKALEKAEKSELVVHAQLARNRDILQNGQTIAAKMGYAAVDSPERALSNISANAAGAPPDPIVITMVARDDRDYARLRIALEAVMNQDPAAARVQAGLQARYVNILNVANANTANVVNNVNTASTANNSSPAAAASDSGNALGGSNPSVSGKLDNLAKSKSEKKTELDEKLMPFSAAATRPFPPATHELAANDTAGKAYQFYSPRQGEFQEIPAGTTPAPPTSAPAAAVGQVAESPATTLPAPTDQLDAPAQLAEQAGRDGSAAHGQEARGGLSATDQRRGGNQIEVPAAQNGGRPGNGIWANPGVPVYRVALRPEQVQQLASQFRVDSITCGRQAYVITPEAYNQDNDKQQLAKAAGDVGDKSLALRSASSEAATQHTSETLKDVTPPKGADQKSPATQSLTPTQSDRAITSGRHSHFVEVIITMEEPPAHPNATK